MISEGKIRKNKEKFAETNAKYNIFTKELEQFLGEDFFIAPASPSLDMYGCYPGGLVDHSMKVCKHTINVNNLLPEPMRVDVKTIVRTVFLVPIGKTFLFKLNENEYMQKKGKLYEYRDDEMVIMSVGERSAYYAMKYGVELSEEEYQAILNSDKDPSERFVKGGSRTLSRILKIGFDLAVMEEKNG